MADIAKALDILQAKGPRKVTYVFGNPAMRETYVDRFAARCENTIRTDVTDDTDLPDILSLTPLAEGTLGIIVRGAQNLTDKSANVLVTWASTRSKASVHATYVLLVSDYEVWGSSAGKLGHHKNPVARDPALREVFSNPRSSTLLIECALANTLIGHTKAADIVRHLTGCSRTEASTLAAMCCYDLSRIKEVAAKAAVLGTMQERHLQALSGREAPLEYIDALLACDKPQAALLAAYVPSTAYSTTLNRLDFALDVLARIHRVMKENDSTYTLSTRMGVHRATIDRYRPLAKHYGSATVAQRSTALLWASQQVALGRREGVLEMVAVQW